MTDNINIDNNTDLEDEGIEIIDDLVPEEEVSDPIIQEKDDKFYTEDEDSDDYSELGLGEDPDNDDDDVDFDLDDEDLM